jgi:hypothetical protein
VRDPELVPSGRGQGLTRAGSVRSSDFLEQGRVDHVEVDVEPFGDRRKGRKDARAVGTLLRDKQLETRALRHLAGRFCVARGIPRILQDAQKRCELVAQRYAP